MSRYGKKIVIIHPHLKPGRLGGDQFERILRERFIVTRSREAGYDCQLVFLTSGREISRRDDDVGSLVFPVDFLDSTSSSNHTSMMLLRWIEQEKPDLVVFKGTGYKLSRWLVMRSSHRFKFAFIVGGGTRDDLLPYASFILAETEYQLKVNFKALNKKARGAVLPKLSPVYRCIDPAEKTVDVINVGRFIPIKNQKSLLPLAEKYRVELIGDGPLYDEVREEARVRGINPSMPGNLSREEVLARIAKARLMVHSSTSEGLPRVFMEAFSCGVPVVAIQEVVGGAFEHGVEGLLVAQSDIITTVHDLLENDEKLGEFSRNALKYATEKCSEESVWGVVNKMYKEVFHDSNFPASKGWHYQLFKISLPIKLAIVNIVTYFQQAIGFARRASLGIVERLVRDK